MNKNKSTFNLRPFERIDNQLRKAVTKAASYLNYEDEKSILQILNGNPDVLWHLENNGIEMHEENRELFELKQKLLLTDHQRYKAISYAIVRRKYNLFGWTRDQLEFGLWSDFIDVSRFHYFDILNHLELIHQLELPMIEMSFIGMSDDNAVKMSMPDFYRKKCASIKFNNSFSTITPMTSNFLDKILKKFDRIYSEQTYLEQLSHVTNLYI